MPSHQDEVRRDGFQPMGQDRLHGIPVRPRLLPPRKSGWVRAQLLLGDYQRRAPTTAVSLRPTASRMGKPRMELPQLGFVKDLNEWQYVAFASGGVDDIDVFSSTADQ